MIIDYPTLIISVLIGTTVATIANYFYYLKTTHKENKTTFLEKEITELLLPLFIYFKSIESEYMKTFTMESFPDNLREEDGKAFMDELIYNDEIEKIVKNKLYLASPKLTSLLLTFIDYQYAYANYEMDIIEGSENILKRILKNPSLPKYLIHNNYI